MWKKIRYITAYVLALCSANWTLLLSYIFCISVNKRGADPLVARAKVASNL